MTGRVARIPLAPSTAQACLEAGSELPASRHDDMTPMPSSLQQRARAARLVVAQLHWQLIGE